MTTRHARVLGLIVAAIVAGCTASSAPSGPAATAPAAGLDPGSVSMSTPLPDLNGQMHKPSEFSGEHGMVLVLVDLGCPFSQQALADVPRVTATLAKQQLPVLVMNVDNDAARVKEFYAAHPAGAPVLYDVTAKTTKSWKLSSVPTVVLLDRGNTVLYRGNAVWASLAPAVEKSLGLAQGSISCVPKGTGFG